MQALDGTEADSEGRRAHKRVSECHKNMLDGADGGAKGGVGTGMGSASRLQRGGTGQNGGANPIKQPMWLPPIMCMASV